MPAPVASGGNGRQVGLAPTGKAPPCHGARGKRTLLAAGLKKDNLVPPPSKSVGSLIEKEMGIKSLVKQALVAAGYEIHRHPGFPGTLFPPGHFYSPIVDLSELERDRAKVFDRIRGVADIDLNEA